QPRLPPGIVLELRLTQSISDRASVAGDSVAARLDKAVKVGDMSLPKGAQVLGRIRRLEQRFAKPASTLVGFEFFAVETTSGLTEFKAILVGPSRTPHVVRTVGDELEILHGNEGVDVEDDGTTSGVGSFRMRGTTLDLPRGFRTVWKTQ